MNHLFFVNNWRNLKSAWSGTPNGLYSALSSKSKLRKIDVYKKYTKFKPLNKFAGIFEILSMGLLRVESIKRIINKSTISAEAPLFVFGEYSTRYVKNTYCYQDLSVDYISRLRAQNSPEAKYAVKSLIPTCLVKKKQAIANQFYRDCAGVFTMSEWLCDDLIQNTGVPADKVHYVGGGCSVDVSKIDHTKKTGNKFLFVGKTWDRKNGKLVVEAFEKLCKYDLDCQPKLYIVGPQTRPDCIPDNENVIFLGRLSYDELVTYYNLCDYFVMPSKFEAYGLVFAEALCFGLPCIGKNICAMPEFIQNGQNGYLIENDDAEELADAMCKLINNGQEIVDFVHKSQPEYIKKYSWDSVADRIIRVLQEDGYDITQNE